MRVEFSPPDITQAEIDQVVEALKSGWITTGPKTKELEREVAQLCGTNKACCLNSATAALEMCLRLLGIGEGDEVIVPAYTYTATVSPVCHVGATPVMVDVAPGSYQMDYDAMEAAITERTKAIIPVDLGGVPCDYDRIFAAVEAKRDLYHPAEGLQQAFDRCIVITDAAHAYGASYKGTPVGSVADFSSFSFHAVKNFTTAEGGALTWRSREGIDDEAVYKQLQLFSLHGQSKDALSKMKLGSWEYDVVAPYFKCNMTDVLAAIGLGQQSRYKELLARRHEMLVHYSDALAGEKVQFLHHFDEDITSSGHLCLARLVGKSRAFRDLFIEKMAEREVACNVHYKPLPMLTVYKNLGFDITNYPNALAQFENEVSLPLNTKMTDEMVDYVIACFGEAYAECEAAGV